MGGALCGAWYVEDKQVGLVAAVGRSASGRVARHDVGLCGLLVHSIGFFLFVGAFPLLVWNEREAIGITRSLEEGAISRVEQPGCSRVPSPRSPDPFVLAPAGQGLVQIAPPDSLDRSLNSKLVHFSGSFQDLPTLTDPCVTLIRRLPRFPFSRAHRLTTPRRSCLAPPSSPGSSG